MPSTFCFKFPVDEFSSNFVLWFWLNEPKVCTWNILRYTFNFNMGNQSMAMIFYLPVCVYECMSVWVRKRMPVMLIYNDHFLIKINKHTWNEYAQFIYSINEYWRIKFNVCVPLAYTSGKMCRTYNKPRKINAHIAHVHVGLWFYERGTNFLMCEMLTKIIYSYVKLIKYLNWHKNFSHVHMFYHIFKKNNCNSRVYRI